MGLILFYCDINIWRHSKESLYKHIKTNNKGMEFNYFNLQILTLSLLGESHWQGPSDMTSYGVSGQQRTQNCNKIYHKLENDEKNSTGNHKNDKQSLKMHKNRDR